MDISELSLQVSGSEGAEETVLALSCEILDVVPEALRTTSHHRRVRAGCVCVFRLGRVVVSEEEERLPL